MRKAALQSEKQQQRLLHKMMHGAWEYRSMREWEWASMGARARATLCEEEAEDGWEEGGRELAARVRASWNRWHSFHSRH